MRVRSTLNWAFLCINAVLFLLLVWTLFPRRDRAYVLARKVAAGFREAAPELEMDVYCSKDPFAVLVDRDFPRKERFSVLIRGRPFFVSAEDALADDAEATKQVNIAFGRDFSLGCDYSTADGPKVRRITLFTNGAYLTDLNADGHFDERLRVPTEPSAKPPRSEMWYEGAWRETVPNGKLGKYEAQLRDGPTVKFDMRSGEWRSPVKN